MDQHKNRVSQHQKEYGQYQFYSQNRINSVPKSPLRTLLIPSLQNISSFDPRSRYDCANYLLKRSQDRRYQSHRSKIDVSHVLAYQLRADGGRKQGNKRADNQRKHDTKHNSVGAILHNVKFQTFAHTDPSLPGCHQYSTLFFKQLAILCTKYRQNLA